jgi:hypothetical protein
MKKFLLKFSDSLLSKEEIRSVKGGYGGDPDGGGTPATHPFTLYCAKPYGGPSYVISGNGCPSFSAANSMCATSFPGTVESNLYCS